MVLISGACRNSALCLFLRKAAARRPWLPQVGILQRSISEPNFDATSKPGTSIDFSVSKLLNWSRPFASVALVEGAQIGLEGVLSFFFGSAFTPTLATDPFSAFLGRTLYQLRLLVFNLVS
jgi:hypothetical protein